MFIDVQVEEYVHRWPQPAICTKMYKFRDINIDEHENAEPVLNLAPGCCGVNLGGGAFLRLLRREAGRGGAESEPLQGCYVANPGWGWLGFL